MNVSVFYMGRLRKIDSCFFIVSLQPKEINMIDTSVFQHKKAIYYTLGCKLNFAETSTIGQQLKAQGVETANEDEVADICVINTCSVTEMAEHKCRQIIHKMIRRNPNAFVVVTGCYAQLNPDKLANIEGVSLVVGAEKKGHIIDYLAQAMSGLETPKEISGRLQDIRTFVPSCSRGNRTRYFLKVQDGCDYYCTYCTIPFARGRSRNGSIASIVKQAEQAAKEGGKEIVLTGVNIGDFGRTTRETFLDLIKALDGVEGIRRYRISSIEPNLLTEDVIDFCAGSRAFMPHFHIPLQSGSDEVLKLMHRKYDTSFFASRIKYIKERIPDVFIGMDVIVGTRGETDELFDKALHFIQDLDVSQLHVFSYSERPGTMALKIPYSVTPQVKHARSQQLLDISAEKTHRFYERFIGTERPILVERTHHGNTMHGFTDNYIRVELPADDALDNEIIRVKLGEFNADGSALKGTIIQA